MTTTATQAPGWYADPAGGPSQRWWDGSQWGALAPTPPKKKRVWLRVLVILAAVFALMIGGCTALIGAGSKSFSDAQEKATADAMKEVVLTSCGTDSIGWVEASGTVTNHSSERSTYSIEVVVLEGDRQVGTAYEFVDNVEPGRTADWKANSLTKAEGATCEVVNVSRHASP